MRTRSTRLVAAAAALSASALPSQAQSWITEFTSNDGAAYDRFGFAIAADGGRLLVSSLAAETLPQLQDVGAAYVFEPGPNGWVQAARLDPSDPLSHAEFGRSLGLSGDVAVVGAPHAVELVNEIGAAYVFERTGGWVETQRLVGTPWTVFGEFGHALAIDGDDLAIGAPRADGARPGDGAVYVFRRGAAGWLQTAVLHGVPGRDQQDFGRAVSLRGGVLAVGAPRAYGDVKEAGRVYLFEENGGAWVATQTLEDPAGSANDHFGAALSLVEGELAVGVPFRDDGAQDSGAVRVFARGADGWGLRSTLSPAAPRAAQRFGFQVELADSLLIVSSPFDDAGGPGAGAGWLFGRAGAQWLRLPAPFKPKLSAGDGFGCAVAIDGERAVIGLLGDSNLHPGQGSVSVVSLADLPLYAGYCFGAGCPCGNLDAAAGCRNSTGAGARLSASGSLSVRAADLGLHADGLPRDRMALLFVGAAPSWSLAGDGLLCLAGGVHGLHSVGRPRSTGAGGSLEFSGPGLGGVTRLAGESCFLQLAYRDPDGPCNQRFNTSNAIALTFVP